MTFERTKTLGSTTERDAHREASLTARRRPRLVIVRPGYPTLTAPLTPKQTIGRDASADLVIADGRISRRHFDVTRNAATGRARLSDAGSKNGTFVNGERLHGARDLIANDVIRAGQTLFIYEERVPPDFLMDPTTSAGTAVLREAINVATLDARPVLLLGPTGAGKTWSAAQIAEGSSRSTYVEVNCGALQPSLVDSELFGHASGAFTGAQRARQGLIESANDGVLFLDEIGTIGLDVQARLLTCLENNRIRRVGENREREVDVRFIAATNLDIDDAIEAGRFRADLKFRLAGHTIHVPSLADRRVDIAAELCAKLPAELLRLDAFEALLLCSWPGNLRELQNFIHSLMLSSRRGISAVDLALPVPARPARPERLGTASASGKRAARPDVDTLRATLTKTSGNVSAAARLLGTHRTQMARWCRYAGIEPQAYRD